MIKNIFIPEKIGNNYIFPKRIIGIDLGKTHANATQLYLKGTKIILEKFIEVPLETGNGNNYPERASNALKILMQRVDKYDAIYTSISSSLVIVKELKLPFIGHDKIGMVVEFEVEPLLPFSTQDAIIDFIVTKEVPEEKSSEVLVAAVQKIHIAQHLQLFEQAGLDPELITIDLFALYGMYKLLPSYANNQENVALIDLGSHVTRIAYIEKGQLRFIRSLSKGIVNIAKTVSEELNLQPNEAMETIIRFGLERFDTPQYTQVTTKALTTFWHEIGFTLTSFSAQDERKPLDRIVLVGGGAEIKGLPAFVTTLLGTPCELMRINELLTLPNVSINSKNGIPHASIMSLSTAFPTPITVAFNLRKKEFIVSTDSSLLNKQLLVGAALIGLLIISLGTYSFLQIRKLKNEAVSSEQEVLTELTDEFPKALADVGDLEDAIEQARSAVTQEEKLWFAFANPSRTSFLTYLLELTSKIDKKNLGFVIEKLTINENGITLVAHVRDHAALALLEKALSQSKLFVPEKQQNPSFTMKIKLVKNV